jgi:hypothetical protein
MLPADLSYADDDFPTRARKLIQNGRVFSFKIIGEARRQLDPLLSNGAVRDVGKLARKPKLQVLVALLMLAESQGRHTAIEVSDESIRVWVGIGRA